MDMEIRIKVNLLQWFRRVLRNPGMHVNRALCHILNTDNLARFLTYRKPLPHTPSEDFPFYLEMLKLWKRYRNFEPETEEAIRKESLWHNHLLAPGLYSQQQRRWQERGVETMGDICHHEEDRLLSQTEFTDKFHVPCTFLEAFSLRTGIPLRWRRTLTTGWRPDPGKEGIEIRLDEQPPESISSMSPKRMYSKILAHNFKPNTAFQRWRDGDDGVQIRDQEEWAEACSRIFHTTRETKVQSFQYKILNRVIPCRVFLKRLRISETDECNFCKAKDTVPHFLFTCEVVRPFWISLCSWFSRADDLYLDQLTTKEFVFGIPKDFHRSGVINPILAFVRYYVHRQKLFHGGSLELIQWLKEFREKLKVEQWISKKIGKMKFFNKWNRILRELG